MSLIDKMNAAKPTEAQKPIVEINERSTGMEFYRRKKERGTLEVCFDYASSNGDLTFVDDQGITLMLQAEEHKKFNTNYTARIKDKFIGNYMQLKVKDIDEDKNIVYLTNAFDKNNVKAGLIKEFLQAIEKGSEVDVWGTVLNVSPSKVIVNIYNRNILGIVYAEDWSYAYTRYLVNQVKKGELLDLRLKGLAERMKGKEVAFQLSRKELHPNPWEQIKDIEEKGVLNVTVIDIPADKGYAWGLTKRYPEIEIMVNKNDSIKVRVGGSYKCRVAKISVKDKIFKVSPFELINTRSYNDTTESYLNTKRK